MTLETYTAEQLAAEQRRKAERDLLARLQAARLVARPIDTTGDLFDNSDAAFPLFATPTPRRST